MRTDADIIKSEQVISDAYLRLRNKLKWWGSMSTSFGGADRFEKTEEALDTLIEYKDKLESALHRIQDITNE